MTTAAIRPSSPHHVIDVTNVKLSEKFKKANVKFQSAWGMWLDNAQSWAVYINEMIDILHFEHPDWSIKTISRVIRRENDSLRGFGESTIYRHLNPDNKVLLDLTQQQNRKGKTKSQNNVIEQSDFKWNPNVLEDSSSSSKASPELEEFRQQKGTKMLTEAIDSVYDLEDEDEESSTTAGEPHHVIYDDPEKIMRQQEQQIAKLEKELEEYDN